MNSDTSREQYRCNVENNVNMAKLYTTMSWIFTEWIESNCKLRPNPPGQRSKAARSTFTLDFSGSRQQSLQHVFDNRSNSTLQLRCRNVPQSDSTMRQVHGSIRTEACSGYMPSDIDYNNQKTTEWEIEKDLTGLYLQTNKKTRIILHLLDLSLGNISKLALIAIRLNIR